jgi:hypothetical protein
MDWSSPHCAFLVHSLQPLSGNFILCQDKASVTQIEFRSSLFALSSEHRLLGGHLWAIVMAVLAVVSWLMSKRIDPQNAV